MYVLHIVELVMAKHVKRFSFSCTNDGDGFRPDAHYNGKFSMWVRVIDRKSDDDSEDDDDDTTDDITDDTNENNTNENNTNGKKTNRKITRQNGLEEEVASICFCAHYFYGRAYVHIETLSTHISERGKGFASIILDKFIETVKQQTDPYPVSYMTLYCQPYKTGTDDDNGLAMGKLRDFYKSRGFQLMSGKRHTKGHDMILYL